VAFSVQKHVPVTIPSQVDLFDSDAGINDATAPQDDPVHSTHIPRRRSSVHRLSVGTNPRQTAAAIVDSQSGDLAIGVAAYAIPSHTASVTEAPSSTQLAQVAFVVR